MCRCDANCSASVRKMDFEFKGLTLWLEFDCPDAQDSIERLSEQKGVEIIPSPHVTLLYGMEDLCQAEAVARLHELANRLRSEPYAPFPTLEGGKPFFGKAWDGIDGQNMVRSLLQPVPT